MSRIFKFRRPDNWHAHLRQGDLQLAVIHHFSIYNRVLCMGNTSPLIDTPARAISYKDNIKFNGARFSPEVCIMLTDRTDRGTIRSAAQAGIRFIKFIPVGTSTGATRGLTLFDFDLLAPLFESIIDNDMHLLLHAELIAGASGGEIPMLEREARALRILKLMVEKWPNLKMTVEHASTAEMIDFVKSRNKDYLRATLTPQHALLNYNDVCREGGAIKNPYNYCLPILKSESDRRAVEDAMTSGDERFFYGSDAAPHWIIDKEASAPKAGIFFGCYEYLRLAEVFDRLGKLETHFEDFCSRFGAEYYGYPISEDSISIVRDEWSQPREEKGVRFCLGEEKLNFDFYAEV